MSHHASVRTILGLSTLAVVASMMGCRPRSYHSGSGTSEAPNLANKPSALGIEGDFSWTVLKDRTQGAASTPWSDSYWPLYEKGMAYRWASNNYNLQSPKPSLDSLWEQVDEFDKIVASGDKNKINALSPAEKYDFLTSKGAKLDAATLKALQTNHDAMTKDPAVQTLLQKRSVLSENATSLVKRYEDLVKQIDALKEEYLKLEQGGATSDSNPRMKEIASQVEKVSAEIETITSQYQVIAQQLETLRLDVDKAARKYISQMTQLLRSVSVAYPMTANGWEVWSDYAGSFEGSWTWMGHCHGWAPAALYEATPKHSVLVKKGNKEILFTEGDIRGLLTKLWADQGPRDVMFASERCNSEKYDTDKMGRIVDGSLCLGATGNTCVNDPKASFVYVKNHTYDMIEYTDTPRGRKTKYAVISERLEDENYRVSVYDNLQDAGARAATGKSGVLHLSLACRDTNPMLLHLALTKLIFEQKTGFVIDVTRAAEVWNQPGYKYALQYLPLKKKDGTKSAVGELVSVKDIDDPFKPFRARGTAFVVQVKAKVTYGMENGPMASWTAKDDADKTETYAYTLEFDKNQKLIGGEWGLVPLANPGLSESTARALISGAAPDFLWRFKPGSKPENGTFDYSVVAKIHECSLAAGEKTAEFPPFGSLKYTECVIP